MLRESILDLPRDVFLATMKKINEHKAINCPGGVAPLTIDLTDAEKRKERGERAWENFKKIQTR